MTTKFAELEIHEVQTHPKNVRNDVGNVVELANSITAQGIMQPLVVAPDAHGGAFFTIIAGHRRHAAAQLANLEVLPCVIREDLNTETKQLEAMLVENTQRTDLTLMEEATAYQGLLDLPGYNAKELARKVGRSQKFVKDRAKLASIPAEAIAKLEAKQMTIEDGLIFAEFTDDEEASQQLVGAHGTYNWDWTVRIMRERREDQAKAVKLRADVETLGANIVQRPENLYQAECEYKATSQYDDFQEWDDAQHIAAGHSAVVDAATRGKVLWLVPADEAPELPEEEEYQETPEEAAERQRMEDLNAGLQVAAHVRHEHLRAQVLNPTPEVLEYSRQRKIKQLVRQLTPSDLATYFDLAEDSKPAVITGALDKLNSDQLDTLTHIAGHAHQDQWLLTYEGWGPSSYGTDWAASWRELVIDTFGYKPSDIEWEAVRFRELETQTAIAAREAEHLDEEEEDTNE